MWDDHSDRRLERLLTGVDSESYEEAFCRPRQGRVCKGTFTSVRLVRTWLGLYGEASRSIILQASTKTMYRGSAIGVYRRASIWAFLHTYTEDDLYRYS